MSFQRIPYLQTISPVIRLLLCTCILFACQQASTHGTHTTATSPEPVADPGQNEWQRFKQHIDSICNGLPAWLQTHGYNHKTVLVADLSIHSGLPRMAVVNAATGAILDSGLVAHGCGSADFAETPTFSNVPNSLCSSYGKYKVGIKYNGNFGNAYKLHGLESSNSKAFERLVVLHAYSCVPDEATYPGYICNSQGCTMVSYTFLDRLAKRIDATGKPLLLWVLQ